MVSLIFSSVALLAVVARAQQLPDIQTVPPDLAPPAMTIGDPAPGQRVRQTAPEYAGTAVYHALYLPTDWREGKRYPVIVEYAGNGNYQDEYGDVCTGRVEDCSLGYGISGGVGFIWVCLPYVSEDGQHNQLQWWGDVDATVNYCKNEVSRICNAYGGDASRVILAGFSRGAIACNFIGLHDDRIATLWCGFICHSHYDGVKAWPYQGSDRTSALARLKRLRNRPQFISHEGSVDPTRQYLAEACPEGDFTFQVLPYRNHTDIWALRDIPERQVLRTWLAETLRKENHDAVPNPEVSEEKRSDPVYTTILDQYRLTDPNALIDIHGKRDVGKLRRALLEVVFGKPSLPSGVRPQDIQNDIADPDYDDLENLSRIDRLTLTSDYGLRSVMYYFHAATSNNRLVLYHQGHNGDFIVGKATIRGLVEHGYDVIALSMPLLGKNNRPVVNVDGVGTIYLKDHEWMRFLDHPLQFFMRPILAAVEYGLATERYADVSLVGLSGGGWSVTLYAALDPRVAHTYQVGGTMPFYLRSPVPDVYDGHLGDFEQNYPPLVLTADYLELYVLGSVGKGRREVQIINQFDAVAAHGIKYRTYEPAVREWVNLIGMGGSFEVYLDTQNPEHSISPESLQYILNDLDAK